MLGKFSGLNPKGPYMSLEKEKETFYVVFTHTPQSGRVKLGFFMLQSSSGG